jgi:hypothetical protein
MELPRELARPSLMRHLLVPRVIAAIALVLAGLGAGVSLGHASTTTAAAANYDYDHLGVSAQGSTDQVLHTASPTPLRPGAQVWSRAGRLTSRAGVAAEDAGLAFRSDASHIFRNAAGHIAEDTPENRALLRRAVKPENLVGTRGPGGSISVYRELLSDGRQVWVEVRRGTEITNGGINEVPRP